MSLWILNMVIPPIVLTYICLSSINRYYFFLFGLSLSRWEMRNERRILPLGIRSYSLSLFFTENGELNWSIHRILGRDWRGSNPQLPPWQGGALTDWTTIPGKEGVQPQNAYSFFLLDCIIGEFLSPCCNRDTNDILSCYYIYICSKLIVG